MTGRAVSRIAWSSFAATATFGVVHGVLVLTGTAGLFSPATGLNSFPIITGGCVLGALVGATVATRQPRNPIGWLFLVGQLGTSIGLVANAYAHRVLQDGELGPRPVGQLAVVVDSALGATWAVTILAAAFLLFPDGSLPSARWRPVLWALPVPNIAAVLSTVLFVRVDTITGIGDGWAAVASSVELSPVVPVVGAGSAVLGALLLLLSVVAMGLRTWRARGERRQQMRWLTTAASALVAGVVLALLGWLGGEVGQVWALVPLFVAYAGVPVAAGVAILRYRLYDIDVVINRAVVGAVVVTFVTIGYVVVVVSLGTLAGGRTGDRYWESVVATAVVALAFQPLRRGVQRLGDRAVYGRRAAPYQALTDLSRRLARAVSPDQILPGVAEATARSLGARTITVRLEVDGADDVVAQWPVPGIGAPIGGGHTVPVGRGGRQLGEITVRMPAGRRLSKADRTLLHDIATQAGLGMHNAQLAAQLRAQVDRASAQAEELEASRQRLLAVQENGRQRLTCVPQLR